MTGHLCAWPACTVKLDAGTLCPAHRRELATGRPPRGRVRRERARARQRVAGAQVYRCHRCGHVEPTYPAAVRHLDAAHGGYGRVDVRANR